MEIFVSCPEYGEERQYCAQSIKERCHHTLCIYTILFAEGITRALPPAGAATQQLPTHRSDHNRPNCMSINEFVAEESSRVTGRWNAHLWELLAHHGGALLAHFATLPWLPCGGGEGNAMPSRHLRHYWIICLEAMAIGASPACSLLHQQTWLLSKVIPPLHGSPG